VKNRTWAILLCVVLAVCLIFSAVVLRPGEDAAAAQVWSDGELLFTLPLDTDQTRTVITHRGTNVITVRSGKVAVTEADCPDGYCMDRGFCSSGVQIVCLPNRLVIRFVGKTETDAVAG
jgi:hypothetical protein